MPNIRRFICRSCSIKNINYFPDNLIDIDISNNNLYQIPELPIKLKLLNCMSNNLVKLPDLPNSLENLNCSFNKIKHLPPLPKNIDTIQCVCNNLENLPYIPEQIVKLIFNNNPCYLKYKDLWHNEMYFSDRLKILNRKIKIDVIIKEVLTNKVENIASQN